MHIDKDQMFHGAALIQIAEYQAFKAINSFENPSARGAFRINASTGIYLKHASSPTEAHREYVFTFNKKNLGELNALKPQCEELFIGLVCVRAREICCISIKEFEEHIEGRRKALGRPEDQYQLLVTARSNKAFRVYVNQPRKKRLSLEQQTVARNAFPKMLFANGR
ncbi:MAG: hypothetical protein WBE13_22425 [Candidatus Acidiferrum sp.]